MMMKKKIMEILILNIIINLEILSNNMRSIIYALNQIEINQKKNKTSIAVHLI